MLSLLIFLPMIGGILSWLVSIFFARRSNNLILTDEQTANLTKTNSFIQWLKERWFCSGVQWIAIITMVIELMIILCYWHECLQAFYSNSVWQKDLNIEWIPFLGIRFHLMLDGLSIIMVLLSVFLTLMVIVYSGKEKHANIGLYYLCLLWCASGVIGLLIAVDLFLFFLFWEMIAIPLYFLIVLWGRRDSNAQLRFNGASKFLIFTQLSSLLMLISVISLALMNLSLSKNWTFDYFVLTNTPISSSAEFLLMLGFFFAFIVRMPLLPFHGWFIDAHIESSTTGSMMISGLLTNTAIYGLLRFVIPMFPNASIAFAPVVMGIALCSLFYFALLAFTQTDIKKLIAYVHVALMSFLTAMIYMGNILTYQGIIIQLIAISLTITGLFMVSGLLTERYLTRNIKQFIGLRGVVNYLPAFTVFFVLAIFGIPGTANFVGNLMLLFGSYTKYAMMSVLFAFGLLLVSIALLIRMQPIFYGLTTSKTVKISVIYKALAKQDIAMLMLLVLILVAIGVYPQMILDTSYPIINKIQYYLEGSQMIMIKEGA
ncbi:NADH-quinone oxidoreductase subunit M [Utexia brackfieldae]|uniref:complex I subunit 4 family protein n=1 Tax=Utexia brackfieldae TaxID=3074108 RepID=UPI00370D83E6